MSSLLKKRYPELKGLWHPGEMAYFEYHCCMSHDSDDAELWYRTHQPVMVVKVADPGVGRSYNDRAENGAPRRYRIRFLDGLEDGAFEDELYTDPKYWSHDFDPPSDEEIRQARAQKT